MSVSSMGYKGDVAVLASRQHNFLERSSAYFYVKREFADSMAKLNVRLVNTLGAVSDPLLVINEPSGSWEEYSVCIPEGTYSINFEAIHGANRLQLALDAVTIVPGCDSLVDSVLFAGSGEDFFE